MTDTAQEMVETLRQMAKAHSMGSAFFDAQSAEVCREAATLIASQAARIAELSEAVEALARQTDNMAFALNNVSMPDSWWNKFEAELTEDRRVLVAARAMIAAAIRKET